MTDKTPSPGNGTGMPAKPVNDWDNREYHGLPMMVDKLFHEFIDDVTELRARQKAYEKSLPTDPREAARKALGILHPDGSEYLEGFEKALHLSWALEALIKGRDLDAQGRERDAALWIARELTDGLSTAAVQLDHISNLLSVKPAQSAFGKPEPHVPQE